MKCPKCGKENTDAANFCNYCGTAIIVEDELTNESRFKGTLSRSRHSENHSGDYTSESIWPEEDSANSATNGNEHKRAKEKTTMENAYSSSKISSGLKSTIGKPAAKNSKNEDPVYKYCKNCGRKLRSDEICPVCNSDAAKAKITNNYKNESCGKMSPKTLTLITSSAAMLILSICIIGVIIHNHSSYTPVVPHSIESSAPAEALTSPASPCATESTVPIGASNVGSQIQPADPEIEQLSSSCDYILCAGSDDSGNYYELVANQIESSQGFEITVGVIKNNIWIYPLSNEFPFLAEDGLFHVSVSMAGKSGTSLQQLGSVIDKLYFIDSGAFLIDCYKANNSLSIYDHYYIIFSCDTLKSTRINCSETTLLYQYSDPSFVSGTVESYGQIYTDAGRLVMYTETSGTSSGWTEDKVFEWDAFDTRSLVCQTIASNVQGVRPVGVLSEGLFFCNDKCFYSTDGQKSIDLSDYSIDVWDHGDILFENGTCMFEVKNSLGTRFLITIDSTGAVIDEHAA